MGDMADAIINGDFDEQTGEWLGNGDGYPRTTEKGYYNTINPKHRKFKSKKIITTPTGERGGSHLVGKLATTIHLGLKVEVEIVLYAGKRGKKYYLVNTTDGTKQFKRKFRELDDFKKKIN